MVYYKVLLYVVDIESYSIGRQLSCIISSNTFLIPKLDIVFAIIVEKPTIHINQKFTRQGFGLRINNSVTVFV